MSIGDDYDGQTVLVTGGAGAIGSNLVSALLKAGATVIVLDDLSSGYEWLVPKSEHVTFIQGSILDEEKLKRAFKHDPEYVFHLAAHFANKNSVDHPETDLEVNGMGTLKVLQYSSLVDPQRVVYASSGCGVYGHDSEIPFEETDVSMQLDTPYQVTKLLGELYTNYFNNLYDLPIANARFFNSFGPGEVPGTYRNVIPNFFYWAYQERPLPITGDGTETRDWTYVGDIVDGLMRMGTKEAAVGESFNLATGSDTEVIDMATAINERVGNGNGIEHVGRRDWDNKARIVGSIEKANRLLGYSPTVEFAAGLDRVHEWFETNFERIDAHAEF